MSNGRPTSYKLHPKGHVQRSPNELHPKSRENGETIHARKPCKVPVLRISRHPDLETSIWTELTHAQICMLYHVRSSALYEILIINNLLSAKVIPSHLTALRHRPNLHLAKNKMGLVDSYNLVDSLTIGSIRP
jgi:hypothetical protein